MLFSIVTTVVPATPSKNLELLPSRTPSEAHLSTSGHGIPINDDDLTGWGEASRVVFFGCFPSDLTNEKQDKSFRDLVLSKKNLSPQLNDQTKRWQRKNASIPCGNLFLQMPGVSGPLQRRFASRRSVETCARSWHRVCLLHETT